MNHNQDSSYFGSLAVGTPPEAFNVILDTGSADMWLASITCHQGCTDIPTFDPSSSSSFKNESETFSVTYGSGQAEGLLVEDTVQIAGFSVSKQKFGLVDSVSANLLQKPVSGLLGLSFQQIATSQAVPLWETLAQENAWNQPVMTFYLTRFINATHAESQEPGGRFTMGKTNDSIRGPKLIFHQVS